MERILITKAVKKKACDYAQNLFVDKGGSFIHPKVALNCLIWQILNFNHQIEDPLPFCLYIQKIIDEWTLLNCLLPNEFQKEKDEFDKLLPEDLLNTEVYNYPIRPAKDFSPNKVDGVKTVKFYERISECMHYKDARLEMGKYYEEHLDVRSCVYCNAQPARSGKTKLFYSIDHYRPQSKFPFLCTSFFNLIPSCIYCNDAKDDKKVDFEFYTEDEKVAPCKPFRFWIEHLDLSDTRDYKTYDIQLRNSDLSRGGLAEKHSSDFNLSDMYNGCKDVVEQVIWNYRELAGEAYKADKPAEFIEKNKLFRTILGLKTTDINIHTEELKKLKLDLAMQLHLVDKNGNLLL